MSPVPSSVYIEVLQGVDDSYVVFVQLLGLGAGLDVQVPARCVTQCSRATVMHSTATATERLKAEGIEGHVEEVCFGWVSGSAPTSEKKSVKHHLRTFHTRGTAQEWSCVVTGVIDIESWTLLCSTELGIRQRFQPQKLRRKFVPGQIHTPSAPSYRRSNSVLDSPFREGLSRLRESSPSAQPDGRPLQQPFRLRPGR